MTSASTVHRELAILSRGGGGLTNTNVEVNPFLSRTRITQNSKNSVSPFDSEGFKKTKTTSFLLEMMEKRCLQPFTQDGPLNAALHQDAVFMPLCTMT